MKDYIKDTHMNDCHDADYEKYNTKGDLKGDLVWFSVSVIVVVLFILAMFYGV